MTDQWLLETTKDLASKATPPIAVEEVGERVVLHYNGVRTLPFSYEAAFAFVCGWIAHSVQEWRRIRREAL